jgi:uncharacterized protein (UPF0147 family)
MNDLKQFIVKELRTRKKEYFNENVIIENIPDIIKTITEESIQKYYVMNNIGVPVFFVESIDCKLTAKIADDIIEICYVVDEPTHDDMCKYYSVNILRDKINIIKEITHDLEIPTNNIKENVFNIIKKYNKEKSFNFYINNNHAFIIYYAGYTGESLLILPTKHKQEEFVPENIRSRVLQITTEILENSRSWFIEHNIHGVTKMLQVKCQLEYSLRYRMYRSNILDLNNVNVVVKKNKAYIMYEYDNISDLIIFDYEKVIQ